MKSTAFFIMFIGWMGGAQWLNAQAPIATQSEIPAPVLNTSQSQLGARAKAQTAKINADSKDGKLTMGQTSDLLASLQTIKDQVKTYYDQNGKKVLTNDQKASVSAMLDQTGGLIRDKSGPKDFKLNN